MVLPRFGGFLVWIKSPPSAIVVTWETSLCSGVFHATSADFGAFTLTTSFATVDEFLEQVTYEAFRGPTLYPCCIPVVPLVE
jgi:hypothetical protein